MSETHRSCGSPPNRPASTAETHDRTFAIRPAIADDAKAIHTLHASCVGDLFAGLLGDYMPPSEERTERERSWTGPIGSPSDRHTLLVAERCDRVIGFVAVGPTRDADHDAHTFGELRTVMVDGGHRGLGIGRALVTAGEHAMRTHQFSAATLWVVPENSRAVCCYERCGWRPDGTQRTGDIGGRQIRSIRYRKTLA
jgi:ribosomal protein S18 acetylase RimI-like enzyme